MSKDFTGCTYTEVTDKNAWAELGKLFLKSRHKELDWCESHILDKANIA